MPELKAKNKPDKNAGRTMVDLINSDRFRNNLAKILPSHVNTDRFAMVAMRQLTSIPELANCTEQSVMGSFMEAGALGLEIGINGECWIIPYKGIAQLQIGYLGHMKLAWNSGKIAAIDADVVTRSEVDSNRFEYQKGTNGYLHHKPEADREITEQTVAFAYAMIWLKDGDRPVWRCIDARHIDRLRKTGQSANSPAWRNHFGEMAIAKALKLTLKWAPKDREQARAISLDDQVDAGIEQDFAAANDVVGALSPLDPASVPDLPVVASNAAKRRNAKQKDAVQDVPAKQEPEGKEGDSPSSSASEDNERQSEKGPGWE